MVQVKNAFEKDSATYERIKFLKSLKSLNKGKVKTRGEKGRSVIIFGSAHLMHIYYNFSLTEQSRLIDKFKKTIEADTLKEDIKKIQKDSHEVDMKRQEDRKKINALESRIEIKQIQKQYEKKAFLNTVSTTISNVLKNF